MTAGPPGADGRPAVPSVPSVPPTVWAPAAAGTHDGGRADRHRRRRVESDRFAPTACSPLLMLVLAVAAVAASAVVSSLYAGEPGRTRVTEPDAQGNLRDRWQAPGDQSAEEAAAMASEVHRTERSASIAAGSVLACWRTDPGVVRAAQEFHVRSGRPAASYADIDTGTPSSAGAVSPALADRVPRYEPGCEFDAARAVLQEAGSERTAYRIRVARSALAAFVAWVAWVALMSRLLFNLRRSAGGSGGVGLAILVSIPIWVLPLLSLNLFDVAEHVWLARMIVGGSLLLVPWYAWRTWGRLASQVWSGSGLPHHWFSLLWWVPTFLAVELVYLLLLLLLQSDRYGSSVTTDTSIVSGLLGAIAGLLAIGALALAVLGGVAGLACLLTVSVAQHVGLVADLRAPRAPDPGR